MVPAGCCNVMGDGDGAKVAVAMCGGVASLEAGAALPHLHTSGRTCKSIYVYS